MRIKSNFYDYYDSLASHDSDDVTYYRMRKEVSLYDGSDSSELECWPSNYWNDGYYNNDIITLIEVYLCGKLYYGFKFNNNYYYKPEKFEEEYKKYASKDGVKRIYQKKYEWDEKREICKMEKIYRRLNNQGTKPKNDYSWLKTPILYFPDYSKRKDNNKIDVVIKDANLKELEFFRCVDTHTTYQEIERWLCNQAPGEKPMPVIDDKTMRDIKGFDKYSFRKDKSK